MSIVSRPIPNQPLFVWPIHKSAISFQGHVQGKQGHHLSVYAKVIAGTQSGVTVPLGSVTSFLGGALRVYGYFLPAHWLLGATRYRIPLIVHIWNVLLNGIHIVATIGTTQSQANVIAESSKEPTRTSAAYVIMPGEIDQHMTLWFNIANFKRSMFVTMTALSERVRRLRLGLWALPNALIETAKMIVQVTPADLLKSLKLAVSTRRAVLEQGLKLSACVVTNTFERLARLAIGVTSPALERISKLSISLRMAEFIHIARLAIAVQANNVEAVVKIVATIPPSSVTKALKLSANLISPEIEHVLSDLKFETESHWLEQVTQVKTDTTVHIDRPIRLKIDTWIATQAIALKTCAHRIVDEVKGISLEALHFIKEQFVKLPLHRDVIQQIVYCPLLVMDYEGELRVNLMPELSREENHYLEADVLPLIANTSLQFRPSPMPWVHRMRCAISICNTALQSYITYYVDSKAKTLPGSVSITMCQGFVRRLVQWYLMGGRVSNEGYGNEVIFDLGEVDPVGPISPSPSLNWEGGYIEDPFLGAGYVPVDKSTGYGSPDVDKWVQNVRMYWSKPSEPFEEPES